MGLAAAKAGILLKETFLQVEAKIGRLIIVMSLLQLAQWILVALTIGIQNIIWG